MASMGDLKRVEDINADDSLLIRHGDIDCTTSVESIAKTVVDSINGTLKRHESGKKHHLKRGNKLHPLQLTLHQKIFIQNVRFLNQNTVYIINSINRGKRLVAVTPVRGGEMILFQVGNKAKMYEAIPNKGIKSNSKPSQPTNHLHIVYTNGKEYTVGSVEKFDIQKNSISYLSKVKQTFEYGHKYLSKEATIPFNVLQSVRFIYANKIQYREVIFKEGKVSCESMYYL